LTKTFINISYKLLNMVKIVEVEENIWNHIDTPNLDERELAFLNENNKITEIVLSKVFGVSVCIFLKINGDVTFVSYGKPINGDIDWEKIYEDVEKTHKTIDRWAKREREKAFGG